MSIQTVPINNDDLRAWTYLISKSFNRDHNVITRLIFKYQNSFDIIGRLCQRRIKTKGRPIIEYGLTYNQLVLLISLMRGSKEVLQVTLALISKQNIVTAIQLLKSFDFGSATERYVYAAQDEVGNVKIGISNNPEERIRNLNIGNAQSLQLIFVKKASLSGYKSETLMHKKCIQFRIRSEWFTEDAVEVLRGNS